MKISVITVSYNCKDTIERTIKSVLNQNYADFEYIIIDGGSTDGTCEIIERYLDRIGYYVSEKDNGIYDAMNKGIRAATGEVINFQGGDDFLLNPNVLGLINEKMADTGCSMILGKTLYGGDILDTWPESIDSLILQCTNHQALFVRTELFDKYGYFDHSKHKILADYAWTIKAYIGEGFIEHLEVPVCYYNPEGISRSIDTMKELFDIRNYYIEKLEKKYLLNRVKKDIKRGVDERIIREIVNKYSDKADKIIRKYVSGKTAYSIYGYGNWGRECYVLLKKYGISINMIFDKNKIFENALIDGVMIRPFDPDLVSGPIIICAGNFSENIEYILDSCGFKKNTDYFDYKDLHDELMDFGRREYMPEWIDMFETELEAS